MRWDFGRKLDGRAIAGLIASASGLVLIAAAAFYFVGWWSVLLFIAGGAALAERYYGPRE